MDNLSTKDLNRLRSQSKIIANRVEIFIETYLLEAPPNENLVSGALEEINNAANGLITAVSKMQKATSSR